MRLARTASLLDHTGWTRQDHRSAVKLDREEDVALAMEACKRAIGT